jgi:hypothetical protein
MLHFTLTWQCPHCDHANSVCVHPDALPVAETVYRVRCRMDASAHHIPAHLFRQVDECPKGAFVWASNRKPWQFPVPNKRRWWQVWKWGGA